MKPSPYSKLVRVVSGSQHWSRLPLVFSQESNYFDDALEKSKSVHWASGAQHWFWGRGSVIGSLGEAFAI
jgi:hypothetical protein